MPGLRIYFCASRSLQHPLPSGEDAHSGGDGGEWEPGFQSEKKRSRVRLRRPRVIKSSDKKDCITMFALPWRDLAWNSAKLQSRNT